MSSEKYLLKVLVDEPFDGQCTLKSDLEQFTIENNEPIVLPYEDIYQITFMDNSLLFSKINIAPLLKYPNYKHCIDVETFDKNNPKNNKVYKLKVQILSLELEKRDMFLKVQFIQAFLTRDTEPIGKMSPYVKVQNKISKKFSWLSKEDKGGSFSPKFNEKINIPISSLKDRISISVMDKDTFQDDIIGQIQVRPFQVVTSSSNNVLQKNLYFEDEQAGWLKFKILSRPKII